MTATLATSTPTSGALRWRQRGSMAQDAGLVVLSGAFCYLHVLRVIDGHGTSVFFAIEQGLLVVVFLTRRRASITSTRPYDWLIASIASWLPLATRPVDGGVESIVAFGVGLQLAGLCATIFCFAALGKSFGIVAANRGLKVHGPYSLVRHPIYLSHTITSTGFLVANFSWYNLVLLSVAFTGQILRIRAEERVLSETSDYASYRQRVQWRLFPGVY